MTDMQEKPEQMDGQELLKLIEAAQAKLDELQVQQSSLSVDSSQEDDEEEQRQEDLQRIRGFH